jgi:hypothetical protein
MIHGVVSLVFAYLLLDCEVDVFHLCVYSYCLIVQWKQLKFSLYLSDISILLYVVELEYWMHLLGSITDIQCFVVVCKSCGCM